MDDLDSGVYLDEIIPERDPSRLVSLSEELELRHELSGWIKELKDDHKRKQKDKEFEAKRNKDLYLLYKANVAQKAAAGLGRGYSAGKDYIAQSVGAEEGKFFGSGGIFGTMMSKKFRNSLPFLAAIKDGMKAPKVLEKEEENSLRPLSSGDRREELRSLSSPSIDTQAEILSVLKQWHNDWVNQRNLENRVDPETQESESGGSGDGGSDGSGGGSLLDFMGNGRRRGARGARGARGGRLGKLMRGKFGRGLSTAGKVAGIAGLAAGAYMMFSDGAAAKEQWTDKDTGDVNNSNVAGSVIAGERSGNTGKNMLNAGLKYSALGAGVGSFIPGVGTAIGAGVGALVGGAIGLIGQENVAGFIGDVFGRSTNDIKQEIGYWGDLANNPEKAKELGYDPDEVKGKIEKYRGDMLELLKKGGSTGVLGGILTKLSTEMARGTVELERLLKESDETIQERVGKTREELEGILQQHKIDSFKEFGGADKVMGMTEKSLKSGDFDKTLKNLQAIDFMVKHPEKFSEEQNAKALSLQAKATEEHKKNVEKKLKDALEDVENQAVYENLDNIGRTGLLGSLGLGGLDNVQVNAVKQEARYKLLSSLQGRDEEDIINAGFGSKAEYERMLSTSEFDSQRLRATANLDSDLKNLSTDYSKSFAERQEQEKFLKARAMGVKNSQGGLVKDFSELADVMAMSNKNPHMAEDFLQTLNETAVDYFKSIFTTSAASQVASEVNKVVNRAKQRDTSTQYQSGSSPYGILPQIPSPVPS